MSQLYTYNPNKYATQLGGHKAMGFGEGSSVKIEFKTDQVTTKIGVRGDAARSVSQDRSAMITITLFPGSPTNAFLSQMADADRKGLEGGTVPFQVKEIGGTGMYAHTTACWVTKKPETDIQKEVTDRVWVLETHDLEYFLG